MPPLKFDVYLIDTQQKLCEINFQLFFVIQFQILIIYDQIFVKQNALEEPFKDF